MGENKKDRNAISKRYNMNKKQRAIKEFEEMCNNAELLALYRISLRRELTNKEFERYKELMRQ